MKIYIQSYHSFRCCWMMMMTTTTTAKKIVFLVICIMQSSASCKLFRSCYPTTVPENEADIFLKSRKIKHNTFTSFFVNKRKNERLCPCHNANLHILLFPLSLSMLLCHPFYFYIINKWSHRCGWLDSSNWKWFFCSHCVPTLQIYIVVFQLIKVTKYFKVWHTFTDYKSLGIVKYLWVQCFFVRWWYL